MGGRKHAVNNVSHDIRDDYRDQRAIIVTALSTIFVQTAIIASNEEPAILNRDVALRAV
jgi:hypothetical protein